MAILLVAALLWGTVPVTTRALYTLADTNALSIGFWRLALAVPALFVAAPQPTLRVAANLSPRDRLLLLLFGVGMGSYQLFYFAAIPRLGVTTAALITLSTAPVMVAFFSTLLLRERPGRWVVASLLLALVGVALLVGIPGDGLQAARDVRTVDTMGVVLALTASLSFTAVTLATRAVSGRHPSLPLITIGMGFGALVLLLPALLTGFPLRYSPSAWTLLIYLGLVPTALGYILFFRALRTVTATTASVVNLLEPLTSALLAWLLFSEQLGPRGLLGGAILLGAMLLLSWRKREKIGAGV
ncbi:MAG: EamA family transporter [Candidatus Promineifilaceae bacterium]|nr:EamA family transporter [Candidatus Promineifilaceae bacterium]